MRAVQERRGPGGGTPASAASSVGLEERGLRVLVGRASSAELRTSSGSGTHGVGARRGRGSRATASTGGSVPGQRVEGGRIEARLGRGLAVPAARSRRTRGGRRLHGVAGAPEDRAQRGAGEEEHADERQQDAEDLRAGAFPRRARRGSRAGRRPSRRAREPSASISPTTVTPEPELERARRRRASCASPSARRAGPGRPGAR